LAGKDRPGSARLGSDRFGRQGTAWPGSAGLGSAGPNGLKEAKDGAIKFRRLKVSEKFKVGDRVIWFSGAQGSYAEKVGTVVRVVEAGRVPDFARLRQEHGARDAYGGGAQRPEESYVVLVPHKGRGKPTLYWPRTSALRPGSLS
jgi:hypothetical protein